MFIRTGYWFTHPFAIKGVRMANAEDTVFARLMEHTNKVMEEPTAYDGMEVVCRKLARRKKIDLPVNLLSFNPACLAIPLLYPLLLTNEKFVAVQNIQSWMRGGHGQQPFLVEEFCQLVFFMATLVAKMFEANVCPREVLIILDPLVNILENKLLYLQGRKKGLTGGEVGVVAEQLSGTPAEKKIAKSKKKHQEAPAKKKVTRK